MLPRPLRRLSGPRIPALMCVHENCASSPGHSDSRALPSRIHAGTPAPHTGRPPPSLPLRILPPPGRRHLPHTCRQASQTPTAPLQLPKNPFPRQGLACRMPPAPAPERLNDPVIAARFYAICLERFSDHLSAVHSQPSFRPRGPSSWPCTSPMSPSSCSS